MPRSPIRSLSFRARSVALPALSHALLAVLPARAQVAPPAAPPPARHATIALDARLATDAGIRLGDLVVVAAAPGIPGDTLRVAAFVRRGADPSEVARAEYRVRMHLADLQRVLGYGDRVDRFAIATRDSAATTRAIAGINAAAFGFRAHRSRDIAIETSRTFAVISRFHKAIGVITIGASAIFLLCIMLMKVEERRRDVAALRLVGLSAASVVRAVVIEAALVSVIGSGAGVVLGAVASRLVNAWYQQLYRTPLTFSLVTPGIVGFAVALSVVLGLAAGVLAARRLVRTPPLALLGR
ncbi:MAG: FtsX-like permease family protein [Gemmatimonadetes bacterium]|nr:FtsX-like permease family protein [Gemmatimonadota bacterium]